MITEKQINTFEQKAKDDTLNAFKDLLETYRSQRDIVYGLKVKLDALRKNLEIYAEQSFYRVNWDDLTVKHYLKEGSCSRCSKQPVGLIDYNGHGHWVCESCFDRLNDEFDEEYK